MKSQIPVTVISTNDVNSVCATLWLLPFPILPFNITRQFAIFVTKVREFPHIHLTSLNWNNLMFVYVCLSNSCGAKMCLHFRGSMLNMICHKKHSEINCYRISRSAFCHRSFGYCYLLADVIGRVISVNLLCSSIVHSCLYPSSTHNFCLC
jgi:hypothetical protein